MRTLAITQNITVDGAIEITTNWFDPQGQGDIDMTDVVEENRRLSAEADALLVGRQTFEELRDYWPLQTDDTTGVTDYLNQVQKYPCRPGPWPAAVPRRLRGPTPAPVEHEDVPQRDHPAAVRIRLNDRGARVRR